MSKLFIRKDDVVIVIAGKDKGKQGKVVRVDSKNARVTVEGVSIVKRHVKPSQTNPQGGVVSKESSIDYSNVMLLNPKTQKPARATHFTRGPKGDLVVKVATKR